MTRPVVSICILTYQHSRFIAKAIEGALMQKTDFPFEILIGEDESTDGTREICLDYARRHPDRIRVFLRSRSDVVYIDGRPRGSFNFRMTLREASGEFIALCEGDDFWTDPDKLQTQVDYLRANPDCVGCFHDAKLVDADNAVLQKSYFSSRKSKFNQHDVLETLLSAEPTCSMLFKRSAFKEPLPEWYLRRPSDLYLDILLTESGSLGFIRKNMAAYRKHPGGIWSGQRESNQVIELIVRFKLLLADPYFFEKYRELILRKIDEFQASLFTRNDTGAEIGRLDKIVAEQTEALKATTQDRNRLQAETDAMARQRDHFSTTATEQAAYIKTLEAERDSLRQANALTVAESKRHLESLAAQESFIAQLKSQHAGHDQSLASLRDQLDKLAATSHEQTAYIASLEKQRDQLGDEIRAACETAVRNDNAASTLSAQLAQLTGTAEKQAVYISSLESERESLRQNHACSLAESNRHLESLSSQQTFIAQLKTQLADHDKTLPALKEQLDQLAATVREQTSYIASLEKQRDQLGVEIRSASETAASNDRASSTLIASLRDQLALLGQTAVEQTAYIDVLKAECAQSKHDHAVAQNQFTLEQASAAGAREKLQSQLEKASALAGEQDRRIAQLIDQLRAQEQTGKRLRALAQSRLTLLKKMHLRQTSHTQHLIDTLSLQHTTSPLNSPDAS